MDDGVYPIKAVARNLVSGYDFSKNSPVRGYGTGHGTIVAQALCKDLPDRVELWDLKVCDPENRVHPAAVLGAVAFAARKKLDILLFAHSFQAVSSTEQRFAVDLYRALSGFGGLFVCSAGNLGQEVGKAGIFPANFGLDNQLTVAA